MKKVVVILFFLMPSVAYGGIWQTIVGDKYRNSASTVCISEGVSSAGLLTKDKELVDARYELCIAEHVNKQIEQEMIDQEKVNQELLMIERQINELYKLRKKMLKEVF